MRKFTFKKNVASQDPKVTCEFLAAHTGLSKNRVKDAMNKGAVWLQTKGGKPRRIRRATTELRPGDHVALYYDERLLGLTPPASECLSDQIRYSVWFKPAGLLTQGSRYGDHCALLRQAEKFFKPHRKAFVAHRLDREASGLVLLAHDKAAAGKLSHLFQNQEIIKRYRAEVLGNLAAEKPYGTIKLALDGKTATTDFTVAGYDSATGSTRVEVIIRTGRTHQIRRHFAMIGYPVMGDPRYGQGNKNTDGMRLVACGLEFHCPFRNRKMVIGLPDKKT